MRRHRNARDEPYHHPVHLASLVDALVDDPGHSLHRHDVKNLWARHRHPWAPALWAFHVNGVAAMASYSVERNPTRELSWAYHRGARPVSISVYRWRQAFLDQGGRHRYAESFFEALAAAFSSLREEDQLKLLSGELADDPPAAGA